MNDTQQRLLLIEEYLKSITECGRKFGAGYCVQLAHIALDQVRLLQIELADRGKGKEA